jgi:hypothetical protein
VEAGLGIDVISVGSVGSVFSVEAGRLVDSASVDSAGSVLPAEIGREGESNPVDTPDPVLSESTGREEDWAASVAVADVGSERDSAGSVPSTEAWREVDSVSADSTDVLVSVDMSVPGPLEPSVDVLVPPLELVEVLASVLAEAPVSAIASVESVSSPSPDVSVLLGESV